MARYLFFAVLLISLFYLLQANPMPQNAQQSASDSLDNFTDQVKKAWKSASDTLHEKMGQWINDANMNDVVEKAKTFLNEASDNIRKEAEKIGEKLHD